MAMPHADYASGRTAWCPDKCNEPLIKPTDRHETRLSIVVSVICTGEVRASKCLTCVTHIQATFQQRLASLGRVAGYAHDITVATFIRDVKRLGNPAESAG
jgi:hypothetical protein